MLSFSALFLCACDLQPKIASIPDSVGMFIENRYPALLADPNNQPEIYNSAITDYGVYASPELYGSSRMEDYVLYASVDDYVLVPDTEEVNVDKLESESIDNNEKQSQKSEYESEEEIDEEIMSEYLIVPVYGGNTVIDEIQEENVQQKEEQKQKETEEKDIIKKEPEKPEIKVDNIKSNNPDEIIVARGDTVYSLSKKNNITMNDFIKINNLKEPYTLFVGQKLTLKSQEKPESVKEKVEPKKEEKTKVVKPIPNVISEEKVKQIKAEKAEKKAKKIEQKQVKPTSTKRVDLQEITVLKGDTLYSLSRKYQIPVNDLAVMNKLSTPFALSVGQKLKVPKLDKVQVRSSSEIKKSVKPKSEPQKTTIQKTVQVKPSVDKKVSTKQSEKKVVTPSKSQQKVNKESPNKASQKIVARSSSKFSWPVRGKILSGYGPKNGGLVNDGINISAPIGTVVKAAENGVVAYAGNEVKGMGNLIIIQHSDGWMTVYAHLNSMDVRRGAKVSVGQSIGKIGKTGKVDKPQLHFEIRKGTKSYNPTLYLKK